MTNLTPTEIEELPGLVESPERIYLEPPCCVSPVEGRQWCEDNVWPIGDGDCEASGVEYVRADTLERLAAEVVRLREENTRAWTERNTAYAKVKAWEAAVYVEGLPLRAVRIDEWGPGEGGETTVPDVTPKRLVDLLDELAIARKALGGSPE